MKSRTHALRTACILGIGLPAWACGGSEPAHGSGGSSGTTAVAGTSAGGTSQAGSATGGTSAPGSAGTTGGTSAAGGGVAGSNAAGSPTSSGGVSAAAGGATAGRSGRQGSNGGNGAAAGSGRGGDGAAGGSAVGGGMSAAGTTGAGGASTAGAGGSSPGCNSANTTSPCGTQGTMCSLDIDGTTRQYYVQLPKSYDAATPHRLIFQFHPWGGSADQALTMYGLNSSIPDAIYVTPQGLDAGSNGPGWANTNGEDIAFTKAMLDDVQSKYCVDDARIFSVGFSYGGMMSFALGCEMSNVFRAIAPMSGALYSDPTCPGSGPHVAMWGSHGTSDTVVPIDDGRAARDKILQQNHCGTTTTPVDPSPCVKYEGCDAGYDVTWCEWDGPHGIPSFGSSAISAFLKQF